MPKENVKVDNLLRLDRLSYLMVLILSYKRMQIMKKRII